MRYGEEKQALEGKEQFEGIRVVFGRGKDERGEEPFYKEHKFIIINNRKLSKEI